jgi:flagellar motor component MotA
MKVEKIIGYFLFIVLFLSAMAPIGTGSEDQSWFMHTINELLVFVDYSSLLIVMGGTVSIIAMTGLFYYRSKNSVSLLLNSQILTVAICVSSLIGILMGFIGVLSLFNQTSQIGPSMAILILSSMYGLFFMALVSIPLEDHRTKKANAYTGITISRIMWFGFPIMSCLFVLLSFFILITALTL